MKWTCVKEEVKGFLGLCPATKDLSDASLRSCSLSEATNALIGEVLAMRNPLTVLLEVLQDNFAAS